MPDPGGKEGPADGPAGQIVGQGVYVVRVRRAEIIDFAVTASGEEDAQDRYLMDGDEIGSRLDEHWICSVRTATDDEISPPG
jgi:hypothetical protein